MSLMIFENDENAPKVPDITIDDLIAAPTDQDFGRPQIPTRRPPSNMAFAPRVKDRWSRYNGTIKPEDVVAALVAAQDGDLYAQNDLFEKMEEMDMALSGFMSTRRLAPSGLRYSVHESDTSDEAKKAADLCRDNLARIPGFRGVLMDMADATGKGTSVLEQDWVTTPDLVWIREIRHIDPKRYLFDREFERLLIRVNDEDDVLDIDPNKPKAIAPAPFQTIAHRSKTRSGHPGRAGFMRVIVLGFLIRNFGYKDWSTYGEVFGMPLRVGKYPAGTGDPEKAALLEAVRMLGSDGAAIISSTTEIDIVESIARGVEPYSALVAAMRTEMALAILGQEMTNNAPGANGARAAAQVQQMVRQDLLEADCEQMMDTIKRDMFMPIVGFNLGWEVARKHCPIFKLHYEPPADHKTLIEVDRILFAPKSKGGLALPITKKQLYDRYGVEPPPADAKQEEFLVQPEDEMPDPNADNRRLRIRDQDGENHDNRDPRERRVDRTRAGSNAAVIKSLLESLPEDERNSIIEMLTKTEE